MVQGPKSNAQGRKTGLRIKEYGLRENIVGSRRTVMCNVEPLLRWIPAPALEPDPGFTGMTTHTVMPDLTRHPDVDEW